MGTCCIIYMNLGPYHIARMRALAHIVPNVHVLEVAGKQELYPWRPAKDRLGFASTTLFADTASEGLSPRMQRQAVTGALSKLKPAVVIVSGYRQPSMRAAANWAAKRAIPTILLFVSTHRDQPRIWWKESLKSRIIKRYTRVAVAGERAEEYALRLGVERKAIVHVGNVVDNDHYAINSKAIHEVAGQERSRLGLPDRYFLTVSRLSPEKNLLGLLDAFSRYRQEGGAWDLVLVGSGPLKLQLEEMVHANSIQGVHFVDWTSYESLPSYYALASCFLLPSTSEPWGLVVNEAMACGLPILVSDHCGCVPELCHVDENGYTFDPYSVDKLTRLMLNTSSSNGQLAAMGRASQSIVASFTPQTWATGLKDCITAVT